MNKNYFDTLSADSQEEVMNIVSSVIDQVSVTDEETQETRVNLDMLRAVIEKLSAERASAKLAEEKAKKDNKDAEKKAAAANGAEWAKTAKVGQVVVFTMGSGKNVKSYAKEILKITDKTITVEFFGEDGKEGKRYIHLDKIDVKASIDANVDTEEEAVA